MVPSFPGSKCLPAFVYEETLFQLKKDVAEHLLPNDHILQTCGIKWIDRKTCFTTHCTVQLEHGEHQTEQWPGF